MTARCRKHGSWLVGAWLALALLAASGCGRNRAGTLLLPTGAVPANGAVTGLVFYDPTSMPDLAAPPYPGAVAELWHSHHTVLAGRDTMLLAIAGRETLTTGSRRFEFTRVPPDTYEVAIRSHGFTSLLPGASLPIPYNSPGVKTGIVVRQSTVDVGNFTLPVDYGAFATSVNLMGDIPGCDFPAPENTFDQRLLGVWIYPASSYPGGLTIPAGTYRFKLIDDVSSTPDNLIGWGYAPADPLHAPFTAQRVYRDSGPGSDLVVTFPTTGVYSFVLDERRQILDITLAPSTAARGTR